VARLTNGAPALLHEFVGVANCPVGQGSFDRLFKPYMQFENAPDGKIYRNWDVAQNYRISRAFPHCPPERIIVAPDCGMKYLPREVAYGKMVSMVKGAAMVREALETARAATQKSRAKEAAAAVRIASSKAAPAKSAAQAKTAAPAKAKAKAPARAPAKAAKKSARKR